MQKQTPISHIIIIMQENHSFDNYFGIYPTANGTISDPISLQLQPVNGIPYGICLPHGQSCVKAFYADSSNTVDHYEGQLIYEQDVNEGLMNGFVKENYVSETLLSHLSINPLYRIQLET
ncbi:MAG: alkaline phosphatase family protein [Conexivisphaerales archaeon]